MRAANDHRSAATGRAFTAACAVAVTLTLTVSVIMGAVGGAPGGEVHLVLAVAVMTALTASLLAISRTASPVVRVQRASTGASGHIEAPTAYWCALAAPRRPQRPRAPGRG